MDDDLGYVDMKGRLYDPSTGRFLSADPMRQFPFRTGGYDRYMYANNDPLKFVDPSGFLTGLCVDGDCNSDSTLVSVIGGSLAKATDLELALVPTAPERDLLAEALLAEKKALYDSRVAGPYRSGPKITASAKMEIPPPATKSHKTPHPTPPAPPSSRPAASYAQVELHVYNQRSDDNGASQPEREGGDYHPAADFVKDTAENLAEAAHTVAHGLEWGAAVSGQVAIFKDGRPFPFGVLKDPKWAEMQEGLEFLGQVTGGASTVVLIGTAFATASEKGFTSDESLDAFGNAAQAGILTFGTGQMKAGVLFIQALGIGLPMMPGYKPDSM
jgi:RHS repeat-associated protein